MNQTLRGYGLALVALGIATLVRWLLDPFLDLFAPFPTYFVAVALVGTYAGVGPAVLTLIAGGLIGNYMFMPDRGTLLMSEQEHWVGLTLFYVCAGVLVAMAEWLRVSKRQLVKAVATANKDLERRREAEHLARESEARLQAIIDNSPLVLFIKDVNGRYLMANQSYYDLFGTTPEDLLGITDFDRLPKEVAEIYWQNDLQVIRSGEAREFEESAEIDGRLRTYASTKFPLYDDLRGLYAVCGISMEITEQKRQQEELREIDRRKDEFLSMLAHELRNPLAPIVTAVEVLRLGGDAAKAHRAIEVIGRQAKHLTLLVNDLLDIARINTGRIQLRREVVGLAALAQQSAESARARFDARDVTLEVAVPREPLRIVADAARITQVIDNLLDNAAKYTEPGGHVRLSVDREGASAVLRVRDSGVGIAAAHLARVFELFEQVDASLDRSAGGLGLGLNLVKRLVDMHGGCVAAHSDGPGRGSEFVVRLPLSPHVVESRPESPQLPRSAADTRVLIIEDNQDAAQSMQMLLEALGYTVRMAPEGRSGLAMAEAFRPHTVLLDLGLPEMDGFEVARALRKRFGSSVRLVAVTGYGQLEYQQRSAEAGFDEHLVKPPSIDALLGALAEQPETAES
jgi:PAS domain S-box-containing protein